MMVIFSDPMQNLWNIGLLLNLPEVFYQPLEGSFGEIIIAAPRTLYSSHSFFQLSKV